VRKFRWRVGSSHSGPSAAWAFCVHTAVLCAAAAFLGYVFWLFGAAWLHSDESSSTVMLIAFDEETLGAVRDGRVGAAITGLDAEDRKSWRLLHGRILERLALADPSLVVMDYFFPDAHPKYDEALCRGIGALDAPVIVGVKGFSANGAPAISKQVLSCVHAYGSLLGLGRSYPGNDGMLVQYVQRPTGESIPGLVLAAYAALRHPSDRLRVRQGRDDYAIELIYEGISPLESESRIDTEDLAIYANETTRSGNGMLFRGDQVGYSRVPARVLESRDIQVIPYHVALNADTKQLRAWFSHRPVVIGSVLPGEDEIRFLDGRRVHGCEMVARCLGAMISGAEVHRLPVGALAKRVALWGCLVTWVCVAIARRRAAVRHGASATSRDLSLLLCKAGVVVGCVLAVASTAVVPGYYALELSVGVCALVFVGCLQYVVLSRLSAFHTWHRVLVADGALCDGDLSGARLQHDIGHVPPAHDLYDFPRLWAMFAFVLGEQERVRVFEPAYWDMIANYRVACKKCRDATARRWLNFAFTVRTAVLVLDCIRSAVLDRLRR
jgi:hypothetical protein